jgi:ATP-dependent Clp protease ATP-binding subunit ClpA
MLGARPLKKLIDKKLLATLSMALIKEGLPTGVTLRVSYSPEDDHWSVLNEGSDN